MFRLAQHVRAGGVLFLTARATVRHDNSLKGGIAAIAVPPRAGYPFPGRLIACYGSSLISTVTGLTCFGFA